MHYFDCPPGDIDICWGSAIESKIAANYFYNFFHFNSHSKRSIGHVQYCHFPSCHCNSHDLFSQLEWSPLWSLPVVSMVTSRSIRSSWDMSLDVLLGINYSILYFWPKTTTIWYESHLIAVFLFIVLKCLYLDCVYWAHGTFYVAVPLLATGNNWRASILPIHYPVLIIHPWLQN